MSAITGIFYRDGRKVDPELIKKMNNRLSHRGPDGSAVWCEGPVALGHQMLWTTPESLHEKLPFEDEESGLIITADARIDNRDELSKELNIEDKEDVSDSYFILKAYEMWGEDCPDKLLGDFAFAIWDKNNEKLFCARDHIGVKPFYYYLNDNAFFFATEIKALLCIPEIPRKLNELKMILYLIRIRDERKFTFYKDIIRLPAANSINLNSEKLKIRKYWELDPNLEILMASDDEYVQKFLDIFTEAVKCRLRSSFSLGFELSGGLDSSSIVCTTKSILTENNEKAPIHTFSEIYKSIPSCDESYYIQKIIDSGGIIPHFLEGDRISPLNQIDNILWYQDEPFDVPVLAYIWNSYKMINKNNIRVLLCGNGGDGVLYRGQGYFKELLLTLQWKTLIREIRGYSQRFNKKFFVIFLNVVIFPLVPKFIKNIYLSHKRIKKSNNFVFINKNVIKGFNLEKYYKKVKLNPLKDIDTSKKFHYFIINAGSNQYFREIADHNAGAFCIEPRYPFYDKRLIEFCYSIPTEQKFKDGWDRIILRKAMKDILPVEVQWRPGKVNFSLILEKNLLLSERQKLNEIIYEKINLIKDYVELNDVWDIYEEYKSGNGHFNSADILRLSLVIIWLQNLEILEIFKSKNN